MTSNIGSKRILDVMKNQGVRDTHSTSSGLDAIRDSMQASGLANSSNDPDSVYSQLSEVVKEELEAQMKPELLNRIDEIIVFSPLSETDLNSIARLLIDKTLARAQTEQSMSLQVGQSIVDQIVRDGSAKADQFGARPMRRAAQRYVEDSLSDAIIQGFLDKEDSATMELIGLNQVQVKRERDGATLVVRVEDSSGIDSTYAAAASTVNGRSLSDSEPTLLPLPAS